MKEENEDGEELKKIEGENRSRQLGWSRDYRRWPGVPLTVTRVPEVVAASLVAG